MCVYSSICHTLHALMGWEIEKKTLAIFIPRCFPSKKHTKPRTWKHFQVHRKKPHPAPETVREGASERRQAAGRGRDSVSLVLSRRQTFPTSVSTRSQCTALSLNSYKTCPFPPSFIFAKPRIPQHALILMLTTNICIIRKGFKWHF